MSESGTRWYQNPAAWGVGLTGLLVVLAVGMMFTKTCPPEAAASVAGCVRKGWQLWNAPPNEIGDALAGFAGTLAFIWIVVTVLMQSKQLEMQSEELRLTREEMKLTRDEMKEQREATQDMAKSMSHQVEAAKLEIDKRNRTKTYSLANQRALDFLGIVEKARALQAEQNRTSHQEQDMFPEVTPIYDRALREENFVQIGLVLDHFMEFEKANRSRITEAGGYPEEILNAFIELNTVAHELLASRESLSEHSQHRFDRMRLPEWVNILEPLIGA